MIRMSEMVLRGHPDKFCDQVADAIVARCQGFDLEAYCQVEVAAWGDRAFVTGALTLPRGRALDLAELVNEVSSRVGYRDTEGAPKRFAVEDAVCRLDEDPRRWTASVNDQAVCVGWAGYDEGTGFLPPEHWLAHHFREAFEASFREGPLAGQGPDGKLLVVMAEEGNRWRLERLLATVEQAREGIHPADFHKMVEATLRAAYGSVRSCDVRWSASWNEVGLVVNPNGPLLHAGTETDNGQTGRKLAMDYYGPRVGQGGGALSGKHASHIDRIGSWAAREAAVEAVRSGAESCRYSVAYAPNCDQALEVSCEMAGRGSAWPREAFAHSALRQRYAGVRIDPAWAAGEHFYDRKVRWNLGEGRQPGARL